MTREPGPPGATQEESHLKRSGEAPRDLPVGSSEMRGLLQRVLQRVLNSREHKRTAAAAKQL